MQYLSFIKRCRVFLHFHCFVVSVRHIVLYFSLQYPKTLFITYFELLQRYIHDSYGLFIHVFKCTYFTIWNKIYVRAPEIFV